MGADMMSRADMGALTLYDCGPIIHVQAIPKQLANRQFSSIKTLTTKSNNISCDCGKSAKRKQRQSNMWKYIDELNRTTSSGNFTLESEEEVGLLSLRRPSLY